LARLDDARLSLQVEQAEAGLAAAQAGLALLKAEPRSAELAAAEAELEAARASVSAATARLNQVLGGASAAQLAAAQADLASAQARQLSAENMHDMTMTCGTFTLPTGEEREICPALGPIEEKARLNLEIADAQLTAAQARYDLLMEGADTDSVRSAQANVSAAAAQRGAARARLDLLTGGPTAGQIAAAEAQVEQAEAVLKTARLALEKATLRAPIDGVVAQVGVTVGAMPAGPAVTVIDPSTFHVTVGIDELDIGRVTEGQLAEVTLDAFAGRVLTGTVMRIEPAARFEQGVAAYRVTVDLAPTDVPVRSDMTANVTIVVEELADVLAIPTWVVQVDRNSGRTYVERRTASGLERVDVQLGTRYGGLVQVLDGLDEGDEVVYVSSSPGLGSELGFGLR